MQHLLKSLKQLRIYETEHFAVCYKPEGLQIEKTKKDSLGLIDVVSWTISQKLWPTLSLADKLSGFVIFAKNKNFDMKLVENLLIETNLKFEIKSSLNFDSKFLSHNLELSHLFQTAWQSLNLLFYIKNDHCYRLIHSSNLDIQADIYGEILWVYWYKTDMPTEQEKNIIFEFAKSIHKKSCIRHMVNRGYGVGGQESEKLFTSPDMPLEWIAFENGLQFKLKQNSGFSPGLFLDQSENRFYILNHSKNKKILNLFSYTSGFSVAAAAGCAQEICSVDASSSFLEWSKDNFILNNIDLNNQKICKTEFYNQDTLLFLAGAKKRKRKWDLIICDPPSFGRTKTTIWKIEKDLPLLAKEIWDCLTLNGEILFTCNYEKWNLAEVIKNFTLKLKANQFEIESLPYPSLDIGLPGENSLTKGFILRKIN